MGLIEKAITVKNGIILWSECLGWDQRRETGKINIWIFMGKIKNFKQPILTQLAIVGF